MPAKAMKTSRVMLTNLSGTDVHVHENSLTMMDHIEHEHHMGNRYLLTGLDMAVPNTSGKEFTLIGFTPWSGEVAIAAELSMDDVGLAAIYENPTVGNSGAVVMAYNANRNSASSSYMTWYGGSAAYVESGTGTRLKVSRVGAAGGPFSFGGEAATGEHSLILKQSGCYAFIVHVDNNQTGVGTNLDYIEKM